MTKLVILNFGTGNLQSGFPTITMQLGKTGNLWMQVAGSLPPAPELLELYRSWQILYKAINYYSDRTRSIEIEESGITHFSEDEYASICQKLDRSLNDWLSSSGFNNIEQQLRTQLNAQDSIRIIIQSSTARRSISDRDIWQLPWHRWQLVKEDYSQAEVVLSVTEYPPPIKLARKPEKIRILAILGNSKGIKVQEDEKFLRKLPNVELLLLDQPERQELNDKLWEQGWDILFFAGHSQSEDDGQTGRIYINQNTENNSLTMGELEEALKRVVANGLQLAIFNSCDGLGLVRELAAKAVPLPVAIVMREPVADRVAQSFLKYFLRAFAAGEDLQLAVRQAREQLRGLEGEFPAASWLPVICQHPAIEPPNWQQLHRIERVTQKKLVSPLAISFLTGIFVVGIRMLGIFQGWELNAFDFLLRMRPNEEPDPRILMVIATPEDIAQQSVKPVGKASLSDDTLALLFEELQAYEPATIGLDIYRDFPVTTANSKLITYLEQNNLFGVCKVRSPEDGDKLGIAPTPEIAPEQMGFADFALDSDRIVRRQLLAMGRSSDATDPCTAVNSLSLLLALHYLQQTEGIEFDYTAQGELNIGGVVLRELDSYFSSGRKTDTRGRQILLNYRSLDSPLEIATTVTVGDIIEGRISENLLPQLKGRIVLIGVTAPLTTSNDYWLIPDSVNQSIAEQQIPGVYIQAHGVSQLVSAVLDKRPLLWFLPWWGEALWIGVWCAIIYLALRSATLLNWSSRAKTGAITFILISGNFGICYLLLLQGSMMPLIPSTIARSLLPVVPLRYLP